MKRTVFAGMIVAVFIAIAGFIYYANTESGRQDLSMNRSGQQGIGGGPIVPTENKKRMTIILSPVQGSGLAQAGVATLEEDNSQVKVNITLGSIPGITNPQPAHIHSGSCPGVGGIVYPLNDVVDGKSETIIPGTIETVKNQMPLAINIHKSAQELNVYTACGEIK